MEIGKTRVSSVANSVLPFLYKTKKNKYLDTTAIRISQEDTLQDPYAVDRAVLWLLMFATR